MPQLTIFMKKKEKLGNVLLISKIKPVDEFMLVVTVYVS